MSSEDLIALFRQRVATEPTAIAVQDRYFTLTYSELERWSNNLGHEIFFRLKNTAGSGTVAICIPRSVLFVVSVLAVIKAGFSYIPLDPSAPPARLDDQVLQSDARLLLTRSGHQLTSLGRAIPFDIVPFMERTCIFGHTELPSSCLNSRNDTLVILFTSGSTGRPKGVLIQHLSMVNMVKARLLEIQPGDCVAMVNNITFDASSLEIWSALCHGGTLFVLTAHLADTEAVVAFFVDNSITKTFLPTAVFHHVISDVSNAASLSKTLRMLVVGGEKLQTAAVKKFFSHAPTTRLVNLYGPTETTIYITTFEIPMDNFDYDDSLSRPIPIGRCLPNTTVYLLDDKLRPVEPGHPGEICIGGAGLSAGYLGQADITSSSKFVTVNDLEEDGSSTRVYRTGDIGRFIPSVDGPLLEFIGRNDNQVKIRGQRLEPGEIEAVLCAGSDGIDQAAVVVTADDQIIAYVVQNDDVNITDPPGHQEQASDSVRLREAFYHQHFENIDPALVGADFTGWVSMYDGVPIPRSEMQDWLSDTLQSIPVKQSDSVLEIGCGTGMMLFSLEPRCQEYYAMDMLGSALDYVKARLVERGLQEKVTLFQGVANELAQLLPSEKRFDLIILNSVVQYFPSSEYLHTVLKLCTDKLQDGGRIFLGDIRNLGVDKHHDLARVLHCDPDPNLPTSEIHDRLDQWQRRQMELKVNPSFFFRLQNQPGSRISHVEIVPKMMSARNELSQFRYQVVLHVGPSPELVKSDQWLGYTTASQLQELLTSGQDIVAVRGIPSSLVAVEQGVLQLMSFSSPPPTASELLSAATALDSCVNALSPQDITKLSTSLGYQVDISIKSLGTDRSMAAVFSRGSSPVKGDFSAIVIDEQLTNCPVKSVVETHHARDLTVKLHDRCREKLPSYMVPHRIIVKASLPLTGNGKVDRRMLAESSMWAESLLLGAQSELCHPENDIQAQVQECIAKVLHEEPLKIPLQTDFISLGLHSFRAPELMNVLRAQFSIPDLPFRVIFQHPTVTALGRFLEDQIRSTSIKPEATVLSERREVSYDRDALQQVLERRGLTPDDVEDVYETTLSQRLLLMGHSRRSFMMHQVVTARTDIDTFIGALETVISRHTALRSTIFDELQRQVVFRYHRKLRDEMVHIYPAEDAQSLESIIRDDTRYALTVPGNLIKFELFRTEPPTLLIIAHHAIMDAWSRECLLAEIDSVISRQQLPEPIPFRNYVDYIIAEGNHESDIAWHVNRIRTADIVGFPQCEKSIFTSSSCLGPDFLRVEQLSGMAKVTQTYGIKSSTLSKVAFALIKRHESKRDVVLVPQAEACRSLPVKGITEICAPTYNIAIDRVDFLSTDTVLELLRRTQDNQDKMTDISAVNYEAVLSAIEQDMTPFSTSSYNFSSIKGNPPYRAIQPGPAGAENDIGIEWTTVVEGEVVKVRVDCDPIFSDRVPAYVDQFFVAFRWLVTNIQARSLEGLES
ncbi:putative nonribosomal peptide synthetase [Serpula lacrymans var. lacrymans S7.9]|nr:putative nonribosomal peptide synthetase [Serpula lacrymans var. lacrymans S7.9]EGO28588.1 putative nonribosomal peptide synthetase [Serpula lacrymans var. lacrymans S7.9]